VVPGLTSGAISGERERQTLDVLLVTPLSPGEIVVSKLLATSAFITLLVVATLPLYILAFSYGGSPWQGWPKSSACIWWLYFFGVPWG